MHTRFSWSRFSVWRIPDVIIGWYMGWGGGVRRDWTLVDQTCWREIPRRLLDVSMDLGRCLRTSLDVRPGQVVK